MTSDDALYTVTCHQCGKQAELGLDAIGKEMEGGQWVDLCDACAGVVRGPEGTPIEGYAITADEIEKGLNWFDPDTEEIGYYSPAEIRQWLGMEG